LSGLTTSEIRKAHVILYFSTENLAVYSQFTGGMREMKEFGIGEMMSLETIAQDTGQWGLLRMQEKLESLAINHHSSLQCNCTDQVQGPLPGSSLDLSA
jgi:hypothetical protein